jgi:hypothetical protein
MKRKKIGLYKDDYLLLLSLVIFTTFLIRIIIYANPIQYKTTSKILLVSIFMINCLIIILRHKNNKEYYFINDLIFGIFYSTSISFLNAVYVLFLNNYNYNISRFTLGLAGILILLSISSILFFWISIFIINKIKKLI